MRQSDTPHAVTAAREAISKLDGRAVEQALAGGEPVAVMIDGDYTPIDPGDVTITKSYGDDWAGAADGQSVVMIDKRITPRLKNEGLARDIIRNVQKLRKEAELEIDDRIALSLSTASAALEAAIEELGEYIQAETLAVRCVATPLEQRAARVEVKIDGQPLRIELTRV